MADVIPGVVVVWTDSSPAYSARRIESGIAIDTVRISVPNQDTVSVSGSLNVSVARQMLPFMVDSGRSALAIVDDIRPFEGTTPTRDGPIVIAGSLGPVVKALDDAARAEEHVAIHGARVVGEHLAKRYAARIGAYRWFRPGGDQHLDHLLAMSGAVRTVVLDLVRPLFDHDVHAIERLLETDLRFVVLTRDAHYVEWLPHSLARSELAWLEIPTWRFDELPTTVHDRVTRAIPDAVIPHTAIMELLERLKHLGEDRWSSNLDAAVTSWAQEGVRNLGSNLFRWFSGRG